MFFLPLALQDDLCAEVRPARNDHQAGDAVEGCGHPVGIELVAHHRHLTAFDAHPAAGHHQRKGQRLCRAVQIRQPQLFGKGAHPLFGTVGYDGQPDARRAQVGQPLGHLVRQFLAAVSRQGVRELMFYVKSLLDEMDDTPVIYEQEFFPDSRALEGEPYTIEVDPEDGAYVVEGPKIDKMLGYTNIDSEKGFLFFQKFLKEQGILKELEAKGIQEGDTVRMYGLEFDYYKE